MITKGVITLAGKGTRVLPLTLHQPKGMINIADKPMFHYIIDEFILSGIKEIILVINPQQKVFKNYLTYLKNDGFWRKIKFHFAYQKKSHGTADAIYQVKKFIKKNEAFLLGFCDDIIINGHLINKKLIKFYKEHKRPIVLLEKVPFKKAHLYGVVKFKNHSAFLKKVFQILEKPPINQIPSNLAIIGRFVFPYEIFNYLKKLYPYKNKELSYHQALNDFANKYKYFLGYVNEFFRFDCGSKEGLVKAQLYFSFNHHKIIKESRKILKF